MTLNCAFSRLNAYDISQMNVLPLIFNIPKLDTGHPILCAHQAHTVTEWDASFPDWLTCTLVTLLLYVKFQFDHLSTRALTSCFYDSTQYALHNGVCSKFRSQAPPPLLHSNTNPRKHSLTSLCSTSADCERAVCIVTSPLRVVCSWWFTLRSVFLLARLEVPSGEHNLCAYEIINKSVPKLCWLLPL